MRAAVVVAVVCVCVCVCVFVWEGSVRVGGGGGAVRGAGGQGEGAGGGKGEGGRGRRVRPLLRVIFTPWVCLMMMNVISTCYIHPRVMLSVLFTLGVLSYSPPGVICVAGMAACVGRTCASESVAHTDTDTNTDTNIDTDTDSH